MLGLSGNGTEIQDPNETLVVQPLYGSNFTKCMLSRFGHVRLIATPWTEAQGGEGNDMGPCERHIGL